MTSDDYLAARRFRVDKARRDRLALAHLRGEPTSLIPAAPIRAHTQALMDLGWSLRAIAATAGVGTSEGLRLILIRHEHVERRWAAVLRVPLTLAPSPVLPVGCWVPPTSAVRRVRALLALGWTLSDLRAAVGRDVSPISADRPTRIRADLWRRIDATFEELSARPGPSELTRARSRVRGYLPPLAWDCIDDPHEQPSAARARDEHAPDEAVVRRVLAGEWTLHSNRADRTAIVAEWRTAGRSLAELARLTGWKVERYYDTQSEVA